MPSNAPTRSEVSPLRHVRDITTRRQGRNSTAYETYQALPSPPKPYTGYDYAVIAEIIRDADAAVSKAYKKGAGSGIVTLQTILQAYEHVLPRHGVKPDEDTYFYRLLLKLSLDPEPDWWAKLNRETGTKGGRAAFFPPSASGASSNRSTPRTSDSRPSSLQRTSSSPRRLSSRTITAGAITTAGAGSRPSISSVGAAPSVRSGGGIPTVGGGRVSARALSHRSSGASLARSSDLELQEAIREATAQVVRLGSSWEASQDAAGRRSPVLGASPPRGGRLSPREAHAPQGDAVRQAAAWAAREAAEAAAEARDVAEVAREAAQQAAWEAAGREEHSAFMAAHVGEEGPGRREDSARLSAAARQAAALQAAARQAAARLEAAGQGHRHSVDGGAAFAAQDAAEQAALAAGAALDAARGSLSLSSGRLVGLDGVRSVTLTEGSLRSLAPTSTHAASASLASASLDGRSMAPQSVVLSEGGAPSALFYSDDGGAVSDYGRAPSSSRYPPSATSLGTRTTGGIPDHGGSHHHHPSSVTSLGTRYTVNGGVERGSSRHASEASLGSRYTSGFVEHSSSLQPSVTSLGTRNTGGVVGHGSGSSRYPSATSLGTTRHTGGISGQGSTTQRPVPPTASMSGTSRVPSSSGEAFRTDESVSLNSMVTGGGGGGGGSSTLSYGVDRYMADAGGGADGGSGGGASGLFDSVSVYSARTGLTSISSATRLAGGGAKSERGASVSAGFATASRTGFHTVSSRINSAAPSAGGGGGFNGNSMRSDGGVSMDYTRASGRTSSADPIAGVRSESGLSVATHATGGRASSSLYPHSSAGAGAGDGGSLNRPGSSTSIGMRMSGRISPVDRLDDGRSASSVSLGLASGRGHISSTTDPRVGARSDSTAGASLGMRTSGRISAVEPMVAGGRSVSGTSIGTHPASTTVRIGSGSSNPFSVAPSGSGVSVGTRATSIGRQDSARPFSGAPSETGVSVGAGTRASVRSGRGEPFAGGARGGSGAASIGSHAGSRRTNAAESTGLISGASARSDGGLSAGARSAGGGRGSAASMRSDGGLSDGTRAGGGGGSFRSGSGRLSASDPIMDGGASEDDHSDYMGGSGSQYRGSAGARSSSRSAAGSGIPAAPGGGGGSRHGSAGTSAERGGGSVRSIPASVASSGGGGGVPRSAFQSSTLAAAAAYEPGGGPGSGPGRGSAGSGLNTGSSQLGSMRSTLGYSSRVASSSFAGFRSDGGDSDLPGRDTFGTDAGLGGGGVSGSEASFREAAGGGDSFSAPASPSGSLRKGSSIAAVPRRAGGSTGSGGAGATQVQVQSYGEAWSDGVSGGGTTGIVIMGGGGEGVGAGTRASGGSLRSIVSGGMHRHDGGGEGGGGRDYREAGDDDGFSFHSGLVPGSRPASATSGMNMDPALHLRPRSPSDGFVRPGVASAGGFGHVSGGGAGEGPATAVAGAGANRAGGLSHGGWPGVGGEAYYTPFAAPGNAFNPAVAAAAAGGSYGYDGGSRGAVAAAAGYGSVGTPFGMYPPPEAGSGGFPWAGARSSGEAAAAAGRGSGGFFNPADGGWGASAPGEVEEDQEEDSGLPEEAEAYMDFSRMARAFRTWRRNTSTRRMSRSERDQALHNWAVATSFWAVQLLRRCFSRWRGLAPRKALMAASIWGDNSRAGCFRRWLVFTRYLRSKSAQGVRLWRGRLLQRCWRQWRLHTWSRQRKAKAVRRALDYRADWTLRGCWRLWQAFAAAKRRKALAVRRAVSFWTDRWLRTCWLAWRQFTAHKRRMTLAMRRALLFWTQRELVSRWLGWRQFAFAKRRKTLANKRAQLLWVSRRVRGCWMAWRLYTAGKRRKMLLVALAVKFWMGSALRGCWRQWQEYAARRQYKALASQRAVGFWAARTRLACLRWWRQYSVAQQHKADAVGKALDLWEGRTLSACWKTWAAFTAKQQRKAEGLAKAEDFWRERAFRGCFVEWVLQVQDTRHNWQLAGDLHRRRLLQKWHQEARYLAKLSAAHDAIQRADHRRLLLVSMQALTEAHSARNEASKRLRSALMRLQNRRLVHAFGKLRAARVRGQWKRGRAAMAEEWWAGRCLARSWAAWRGAQVQSANAMEAARDFALKVLRPLLRDVFYGWLDWHEDKMLRRCRDEEARRVLHTRRQRLVLRAWRRGVLEKRHLASAAQLIMRNEVTRLMGAAFRQLRRETDNTRRAADARRVVQRGAARRCLRHWKALGRARLVQEEWRTQRLRLAAVHRARRVLTAWQLVACLHAEHGRLVASCVIRSQRRRASAILGAWRGRVLHSVTKRMKMLAALLAWERGVKARAWRVWSSLRNAARASASRFALAARHHRTRRLSLCFDVLTALWRQYREAVSRALRFRFTHAAALLSDVLAAWRQLVGLLRWKNARWRRAATHASHRLLAGSLYGWFYVTRDRVATKQAVAVAVLHWVRRRRAAALAWWRVWAVTQRALRLRCEGYALLRAARVKAWVLLMLRANMVRNARIAGAVAHRKRYMARLALSGWLLRTLLAGEWVNRLRVVAKQLSRQLLARCLAAWLEFIDYRHRKQGMVRAALHYWRLGRQRSALDGLRWHATRRQIMRAAVARGRQGAACRVLRAWRQEADYRRGLRDRYALMMARSRRTALKRGLDRWRAFLALRAYRRDQQHLAALHHLRGTAGRAYRSWHMYHMQLRRAKERAKAIVRRWRRRDAAEALAAFAENVVFQRQMRDAAAVFRQTCARRAFTAWREFLVVQRATDFWSHNRLTEVMSAWRQYTLWRRGLRAVGERIALRWRSLTAASVLAAWRGLTAARRRLMELGYILASRTTRCALSALLFTWLDQAARSARLKRAGEQLAARTRAGSLAACLAGWHAAAARRVGLRATGATLAARVRHAALASAFGAWCWYAANAARLRLVSQQVASRTQRGILAAALAGWCCQVTHAARLRGALALVAARVRRSALAATFSAWRGRTAYVSHLRTSEGLLAGRLRAGAAGAALAAWHVYAARRAHLRIAEHHVSTRLQISLVVAVFEEWRGRASRAAHLRRAEHFLSNRLALDVLGGIFGAWHERASTKARLRHAGALLAQRARRAALRAALGGWRRRAVYKARLAAVEAVVARRGTRALLVAVCGAWRKRAAYGACLRRAGQAVGARWRLRLLAAVYGEWAMYAARMAALKGLLERVLVRATALAFYGWREMVAEAQRWRAVQEALRKRIEQKPELGETASYAVARLRLWPLSVAFYTWYDNARKARYLRDRTTDAVFAYAGGLMRKAWAIWLAYALRRRHVRHKLARCRAAARVKTLRAAIREWRQLARYHGRLRLAAAVLRKRVGLQILRSTLALWRDTAARWAGLKCVLARAMARLLSAAWEAWSEQVAEARERAQAARSIAVRIARRNAAAALHAWRRIAVAVNTARRLHVRAQRQRLSWAWAVWQAAVFEAGVARGGELHERQIVRRALRGWRAVAADSRRGAAIAAALQQRMAHKALMEWRRQWLVRASCRRLYCRRALLGWHSRTQELRSARARLWHASRLVLFGCQARCFSTWWQHTQAMAIKRAVFVRKQRALAEALRRGDELAARRNAELAELAFRAWQLRASIGTEVRRRQAALRARTAAAACAEWREYARARRTRAAKRDAILRRRLLARPMAAWRAAASASAAKLATAAAHRRAVLLDAALTAWQSHHAVVGARAGALKRALAAGAAAGAAALRARAWEGWCEFMVRRVALWEVAEQARRRRCRRVLGATFDVWLKYTQAMRSGGIDPGSPYLTPRDRSADRWLVTRMAALAGNEQALSVPESSSLPAGLLDGLYPTSALKAALERRQEVAAFLTMARHNTSAGGGARAAAAYAGGGTPATAAATAALTSAMLVERQRQRERRDSHGSAGAGAGEGWGGVGGGSGSVSMAGSSHGSALTSTLSSGAGGADLAELALQVVRATPALGPAGKARTPATAGRGGYAAATQRVSVGDLGLGVGGSPYDDRLDLRALYEIVGPYASNPPPPVPFGGFLSPSRPPHGESPVPLPRAAAAAMPSNPPSAAARIAPRRIDFTVGRGSIAAGPPPPGARDGINSSHYQHYYGHGTPSYQHASPHHQYHQSGVPYSAHADADRDSDVSSTTSSDLLAPAEARARAAAATAAAAEDAAAAAAAATAVASWRRGAGTTPAGRSSPTAKGGGGWAATQGAAAKGRGGSSGSADGGGAVSRTPAAGSGRQQGLGGALSAGSAAHTPGRQTPGGRSAAIGSGGSGGAPGAGGGGGMSSTGAAAAAASGGFRGSILDRRAAQGR